MACHLVTVRAMGHGKEEVGTAHTIGDLYPHFTGAQRMEAEENLERYLELALGIHERIQADPDTNSKVKALTHSGTNPTMNNERSNPTPA